MALNNTLIEATATFILVAAIGLFALATQPPHPRPKPEPDASPVVVKIEAPKKVSAQPITKQQFVNQLEKKLEQAEDDLSAISKIVEQQQAEKAAKQLNEIENKSK
jgi:hypothetical protein